MEAPPDSNFSVIQETMNLDVPVFKASWFPKARLGVERIGFVLR